MSNVLIGIIGVILFIGLALAGALILGDDFKNASSSTGAAAISSDLQQIAAAANMYQLKTGSPLLAANYRTNIQTLVPRFLKTNKRNPITNEIYATTDINGSGAGTNPVHHIYTAIGPGGNEKAKRIYYEIESQANNPNPDAAIAGSTPAQYLARANAASGPGCIFYIPENRYIAFIKI